MADWGKSDLSAGFPADAPTKKRAEGEQEKRAATFGQGDWSQGGPPPEAPPPDVEDLRDRLVISPLDETQVGAFMGRAADMMTGGISDEVGAAGVAGLDWLLGALGAREPMPFGERYGEIRDAQEGRNRHLREEFPTASLAGDITGFVAGAPGKVAGKAFDLASRIPGGLLPRTLGYTAAGGLEGGAVGLTTSEGENRLRDAQRGAIVGGVSGGTLGPALDVASRAIAGRMPKNIRPNQAAARVESTIKGEGMSPPRVAARMRQLGPDAILADTTPGLRQLLDDVVNRNRIVRSTAERKLTPRQEALGEEVISASREATGAEGKALASAKAIADQKRAIANEHLPEIRAQGFQVDDTIENLLKRGTVRGAYDDARAIASDEGVDLPPLVFGDDAPPIRDQLAEIEPERIFETFDYMRKALNQRAALSGDTMGAQDIGSDALARMLSSGKLARDWRDALKGQSEPYAQYLSEYADEFANDAALKLGQKLWQSQAKGGVIDELPDMLKGMSESERAYLREGLVQSVRDSIETGNLTGDAARRVYKTKRMRDIFEKTIKAGLPEETAEKVWRNFDRSLQAAIEKAETFRVLGGSQTARRTAGNANLGEGAMMAGEQALVGDRVGAVRTLLRSLGRRQNPADDIALGNMLMDPNFSIGQLYAQQAFGSGSRGALAPAFGPLVEGSRQTDGFGLLPAPQSPR